MHTACEMNCNQLKCAVHGATCMYVNVCTIHPKYMDKETVFQNGYCGHVIRSVAVEYHLNDFTCGMIVVCSTMYPSHVT